MRPIAVSVIDSLRAVTPGIDENDARMRDYTDVLSKVSETTGTAFQLIHHSGKGDGDRAGVRGSSAIFDSCGCVFELKGEPESPTQVRQIKGPAEAEGGRVLAFQFMIEDVQVDNNPKAGVRVVYQALDPARAEKDLARELWEFITNNHALEIHSNDALGVEFRRAGHKLGNNLLGPAVHSLRSRKQIEGGTSKTPFRALPWGNPE